MPPDPHQFLLAYYRLRAGIDTARNWTVLLSQVPATPEGRAARFYHRREYLDRLLNAALASEREQEALLWLANVSQRCQDALDRSSGAGTPGVSPTELRQTESLLNDYIARLNGTSGPHSGAASPRPSAGAFPMR